MQRKIPPPKNTQCLVLDENKFKQLTAKILDPEEMKKQAELDQKRKEYEERKIISDRLIDSLENTLDDIRKKRLAEKERLFEEQKEYMAKKHEESQAQERKLKEEIREKAKAVLYQERDTVKSLNSAFRYSEALRQRQKQIEFNDKLREEQCLRDREYDRKVLDDVKLFKEELEEEKLKKFKQKKDRSDTELTTLNNAVEEQKRIKEERIRHEYKEIMNIRKEINYIEEQERKSRQKIKDEAMKDQQEIRKRVEEKKIAQKLQQEEEEEAIKIIAETKEKIARIRRQRELENLMLIAERARRNAELVAATQDSKEEEENERLQRDEKRRDDSLRQRDEADRQNYEKLRSERIEFFKKHFSATEARAKADRELLKWETLHRLKMAERDEEFKKFGDKKNESHLQCKEFWGHQAEEQKQKLLKEKLEDEQAVASALKFVKADDKEFLDYAESVIKECEQIGRPTYPICKTVEKFKKDNNMEHKSEVHELFQSQISLSNPLHVMDCLQKIQEPKTICDKVEKLPPANKCGCGTVCYKARYGLDD